VKKKIERDLERDSLKRKGQQAVCISQGDFLCEVAVFFAAVGGLTVRIHTVHTARKKDMLF
jgi:hypothetical protein